MEQASSAPLVSVVIPVFNGVNYLREAVESIFAQTYANIELILVDDGSTDATWDLIQSYGERVCAIHKENGGVASALNTGFQRAKGELVAWLSHDDIFLPDKITRQVGFLIGHPEFGSCYTDFEIIGPTGEHLAVYHSSWVPAAQLARSFLKDMHINGSTVLIRKTCFERAGGFDDHLPHTQDLDMWLRLSEHGEMGYLPEVLVKFRSHPAQGSLDFELQIADEQALFRDLFERRGPLYFFPELTQLHSPTARLSRGFILFGDDLRIHRRWYRFALEQYRRSIQLHPAISTRWKIFWTRVSIALLGDEREALTLGKRARISLDLGKQEEARRESSTLFMRHPLRIDMLLVWMASWTPPWLVQSLKQIKRRLRP